MKETEKPVFTIFFALILLLSAFFAFRSHEAAGGGAEFAEGTLRVELLTRRRNYESGTALLEKVDPLVPCTAPLSPIEDGAFDDAGDFDSLGMPLAEGYRDHIVQVTNTGEADAYVRVLAAIPAALDEKNEAGDSALIFHGGERFREDGSFAPGNETNPAFSDIRTELAARDMVGGVLSNIYSFTYSTALKAGETTPAAALTGFCLSGSAKLENGRITLGGADTGFQGSTVEIPIRVQAVQAQGFENAEEAFRTVYGEGSPWADGAGAP